MNVSVNMVNTETILEEEDGNDGSIIWQKKVGQDLIDIMGANMLTQLKDSDLLWETSSSTNLENKMDFFWEEQGINVAKDN